MPRESLGPRLQKLRLKGYREEIYFAVWYEQRRRRIRSSGTANRQDAESWFYEEFLPAWRASQTIRPDGPRRPDQMTVAQALTLYGQEHAPTTADPAWIGYAIRALLPFWGDLLVSDIKGSVCRRYSRERETSAGTVLRELRTLNAGLQYAVAEGYLITAPKLWYPEAPPAKDVWLTRPEAGRLVRAARNMPLARLYLPLFILIGLYTGARKTAILNLQWQPNLQGGYVDLQHNRIDFNAIGARKTNKRKSVIQIPRRLRPFLKYARQRNRQYVVEIDRTCARSGPVTMAADTDRVPDPGRVADIKKSFARAAVAAGLCNEKGKPTVSPHTLRHTCCTWLALGGVDLYQAARFVEMDVRTFIRVYAKHHPSYMQEAANAFG